MNQKVHLAGELFSRILRPMIHRGMRGGYSHFPANSGPEMKINNHNLQISDQIKLLFK